MTALSIKMVAVPHFQLKVSPRKFDATMSVIYLANYIIFKLIYQQDGDCSLLDKDKVSQISS